MQQARAVGDLHILEHTLVVAKMSVLRDKTTATVQFRRTLEQIAILLLTEVSKSDRHVRSKSRRNLRQCAAPAWLGRLYLHQSCVQALGYLRECYE